MPVTVRVHGLERPRGGPAEERPAITLDAPRIVLGRSDGCEVRLPDPSVSPRHVTIRQRGADYVIVDEGSTNGTRVGKRPVVAHAPERIGPRELVRVGRVWVEIEVTNDPPTRGAPLRAREIALSLVTETLARDGEDVRPRIRVTDGPSRGAEAVVEGDGLVVGRSRDAGLTVEDEDASRRHVEIRQRGDALVARDLGSRAGTLLGERALGESETVWKRGEELKLAGTTLVYTFGAADALGEIERQPDLKIPLRELEEVSGEPALTCDVPPVVGDDVEDDVEAGEPEPSEEEAEEDRDSADERPAPLAPAARSRRGTEWSLTDFAVVLLAMGVFSLSAVGYWVLLR